MRWIQTGYKAEQVFDSIKGILRHEKDEGNQAEQ